MSQIGVDERTYQTMYQRTFAECLNRQRGDTTEARKLAAYYMRDWYVVTDGRKSHERSSISSVAKS
jgi:hypothetical protein